MSWVLPLVLVFQGAMGRFARPELDTPTVLAMVAACTVLFFVSLLLHELGHALRALREKWQVDKITLFALVGYTSVGLAHQIPAQERDRSTVFDTMVRWEEAIQLDPNTPLDQALERLGDVGDRGIVVEDGRVTGIVSRQAVAEALLEASDARSGRSEQAEIPW